MSQNSDWYWTDDYNDLFFLDSEDCKCFDYHIEVNKTSTGALAIMTGGEHDCLWLDIDLPTIRIVYDSVDEAKKDIEQALGLV